MPTSKSPPLDSGHVFEVAYPFIRATYQECDADESGSGHTEVPTWKPGVRFEDAGQGDVESIADALGRMVLTIISVHQPGRYPTRAFFTREWIDPDGKRFGKKKLRITTVGALRALTRGYRHQFVLLGCDCQACDWPYNDHRRRAEMEYPVVAGGTRRPDR